MPLLIPVAKAKTGETVPPTCSKEDGPFTCLGCSKELTLKQGVINQWHFAHHADANSDCSAGGESYNHLAAKLILSKHIARFEFTQTCDKMKHKRDKVYGGCTAVQEYRFDGRHSADVGVFRDENLEAIVEVVVTHKTEGEALASRISRVGADDMWEVDAIEVLKRQNQLRSTRDVIRLPTTQSFSDCVECAEEAEQMRRQKEELNRHRALEKKAEQEQMELAIMQGQGQDRVVIIDDNTLLRNDVLLKKSFLNPGSKFDRRYVWVRAT